MLNYFLSIDDFEEYVEDPRFSLNDYYILKEDKLLKDLGLFEKYIIAYFKIHKNYLLKKYSDENVKIDLLSPYFPIFCKTDLFEQIFTVNMPKKINDAFNIINETNKTKNKISSIIINFINEDEDEKIKDIKN